jgi:hypothetical protein
MFCLKARRGDNKGRWRTMSAALFRQKSHMLDLSKKSTIY